MKSARLIHSRRPAAVICGLITVAALSACSSSSSLPSASSAVAGSSAGASSAGASGAVSSPAAAAGTASALAAGYDGPSKPYFTAVADPAIKAGLKFALGYSDPYAAIPGLLAEEKAACAEAVKLGGTCISKDANVSVQTQVSQVNELLTQKVSAIAISPLDPQALSPSFTAARSGGVPVVATELPADPTRATNPLVYTSINQALDYSSWATMSAVATAMPGASFVIMGTASPNPLLQYLLVQEKQYATQFGLTFLGEVDAQQDNPSQWASAATTLSQKYPEMKLLLTYNDPAALAASGAIRSSGRTDVKVADANGYSSSARAAITDGKMVASYAVPWAAKGRAMAIAAYNAQTGQKMPKIVAIKGEVVTAANAGTVETTG